MSNKILFLTQKMSLGFGVAVVVHNISIALQRLELPVEVACLEKDGTLDGSYPVHIVAPSADEIDSLLGSIGANYVIAHSTPFFELLPTLGAKVKRWVWEHGDPTPDLFPVDGAERKRIADSKRLSVYPHVHKVIAISEFIRSDIGWPEASVIYNGCEHIEPIEAPLNPSSNLNVGTLVRLGPGEGFYKGGRLYLDLVHYLSQRCENIDFHLMGRGTAEDAAEFEAEGVAVYLNATDEDRSRYLSNLDIFVSMSLWEGFNLPLVEAAVSGALPFALDTGAHPEVTPYIFSSVPEMAGLIEHIALQGRETLAPASQKVRSHVQQKFSWRESAESLAALIE